MLLENMSIFAALKVFLWLSEFTYKIWFIFFLFGEAEIEIAN